MVGMVQALFYTNPMKKFSHNFTNQAANIQVRAAQTMMNRMPAIQSARQNLILEP